LLRGGGASSVAAFAFGRLAFTGRFELAGLFEFPFVLPLSLVLALLFSFLFAGLGLLGLLSFELEFLFEEDSSTGFTVSGVSPSFATRLTSIATV